MARVTIGVPVFNAESFLERALENLAQQSFQDFRAVILDNASTDRTGAIARSFVARHPKFTYLRQSHNKGSRQNFVDALDLADTPYFMWRAYDDVSSTNYLEELVRLLDASPGVALAVGRTILEKKKRTRVKPFPWRTRFEPSFLYKARFLLRAPPSWIYGLFRTDELRWSLRHVTANYNHVHAFDVLTILPFVLKQRVVGTDSADFAQGFVDRDNGLQQRGILDPRMMQALRDDFVRYCRTTLPEMVDAEAIGGLTRVALWKYADRSYRWPKILNANLRMMFGEKPRAATMKYEMPADVAPSPQHL
jgi:glycosyltransferase involved in cell wall biosynthesis